MTFGVVPSHRKEFLPAHNSLIGNCSKKDFALTTSRIQKIYVVRRGIMVYTDKFEGAMFLLLIVTLYGTHYLHSQLLIKISLILNKWI